MRWFALFITLMFTGCQPSYSEKEVQITEVSCQVATILAKRSLAMFRDGQDQFDVMTMLNNYNASGKAEANAGKVFTQVMVIDLLRNVKKAYRDKQIMTVFTDACTAKLGFKIPKGKY